MQEARLLEVGQLKIFARIGTCGYYPALQTIMTIHNPFNIILRELYNKNKLHLYRAKPPSPITIKGEPECKFEEIVNSQLQYNKTQYRAQ